MFKGGQTRFNDTINYIGNHAAAPVLAGHIRDALRAANVPQERIGKELSLGSRADDEDDPQYAGNTQRRHALRALLLCQRVYFSEIALQVVTNTGAYVSLNVLPRDWKAQSLNYWGTKTEAEIVEGIKTYTVRQRTADKLADVATEKPKNQSGQWADMLKVTRTMPQFTGLSSCYGAVMTWLFKSGMVSYHWYMNNSGANSKQTLTPVFGLNNQHVVTNIWRGDRPFTADDTLPQVPRGHIVHLYVDNPLRWNGHWLVSNGDGTASACNNDIENGAVPNDFSTNCSLNNQFLFGYKHELPGKNGDYERGVADVIHPLSIPNRM